MRKKVAIYSIGHHGNEGRLSIVYCLLFVIENNAWSMPVKMFNKDIKDFFKLLHSEVKVQVCVDDHVYCASHQQGSSVEHEE